jgi:hypothetical protein
MHPGRFWTAHGVFSLVVCLSVVSGCARSPQLGDEECLKAADALWTAVTARQTSLLDVTAGEIEKLHASAKLSPEAFHSLSAIIETARAGQWTDARIALKVLIRAQRPAPAL